MIYLLTGLQGDTTVLGGQLAQGRKRLCHINSYEFLLETADVTGAFIPQRQRKKRDIWKKMKCHGIHEEITKLEFCC